MFEVRDEHDNALLSYTGRVQTFTTREDAGNAAETLTKAIGGQWRAVDVA